MCKYDRKGEKYSLDEVLPYIEEPQNKKIKKEFDGDMIKMTSDRLYIFKKKGHICVECGLEGEYIVKEKAKGIDEPYHFNMYGINENGEEVIFTKDHIIPKSKGGKNHIDNYQPMCSICNEKKGNKIE